MGTTCGSSLAPAASCSISISFKPSALNKRSANLSVGDDGGGSPQLISLLGAGTVITFSPTSLMFSGENVGTTSTAQSVSLMNHGTTALAITAISIAGTDAADFIITTETCGTSLAAGANCSISVAFKPTSTGARKAVLNAYDNGGGSPQHIGLVGTGL
jgi:hypothetical protein